MWHTVLAQRCPRIVNTFIHIQALLSTAMLPETLLGIPYSFLLILLPLALSA
jgi:hypothetical protein